MSQMPIFSYKQYLDDISRMKQTGTIGADQQAESPSSAGSRGLKRTKQFIKDPVHLMGESEDGRPTPAQPNAVEDIRKVKDGYRLTSKKSGRNLGTYPTRAGAEKRERQVQYFKHRDDQSMAEVFESWLQRRIPEQFHEGARTWFEAKYQGRTVPLNKPMRGDVKKFKVYVKNPKTGNVKKVNFGHGGTSAKKLGQKTMKIRKSNPKARKSFRARHKCDTAKDKTTARYWSCRKW